MNLLNEYKQYNVQITPKSIVNTLKQLDVKCSPYGLRYSSEAVMDMIVFYDQETRIEIALINNYIVSIEDDTLVADMTQPFRN
jgi:hypothetical protein